MEARKKPFEGPDEEQSHAGDLEAEQREKLAELVLRRSKLDPAEVALFRRVFPALCTAQGGPVWSVLRRKGVREADLADLWQDVFAAFFAHVVEYGFPDSVPAKLHSLAAGNAANERARVQRAPITLGMPSSGSTPPWPDVCSPRSPGSNGWWSTP